MTNNKFNNKNTEIKLENLNLSKKTLETILEHIRVAKKRLDSVENIILESQRSQYSPTRDVPGETGIFDGEYLVTSSGIKYEVPKNYAAKSLLIVGDELKRYQDNGEDKYIIFKKIPRKKVEGILSKKDGRYYVLLENNKSYQLAKQAVEFRNLKQGDRVVVIIPETENGSDFAAIDKIAPKKQVQSIANKVDKPVLKEEKKEEVRNKEVSSKDSGKNFDSNKIEFTDEDLL